MMGNDDIEIKGTYIAVNDDFIHISQGGYDSIKIAREDIKVFISAFKKIDANESNDSQEKPNGYTGLT